MAELENKLGNVHVPDDFLTTDFGFMVTAVVRDPSGVSKVFLSVDGEIVAGRTDSPAFHVFWIETRSHAMEICVVADDRFGNSGRKCADVEVPVPCSSGEDCAEDEYCAREEIGDCVGPGVCLAFDPASNCVLLYDPVCGCDGETYNNTCEARSRHGVNIAHRGRCEDGPPEPIPAKALSYDSRQEDLRNATRLRKGRELFTNSRCVRCHTLPNPPRPRIADSFRKVISIASPADPGKRHVGLRRLDSSSR